MTAQVALHIAFERALQTANIGQHRRIVTLLLGRTTHHIGILTALRAVRGLAVAHHLDKRLEILVRDRECRGIQRLQTLIVGLCVVVGKVLDVTLGVERHHKSRCILRLALHIGHHATTVVDLTTALRCELADQRIGHIIDRAILVAMCVVDGLNTAAAGHIVFCGCDLQVVAIAHRAGRLDQTLAERAATHQHRAIHILQRARHDLGRRSRAAIGQHDQRQLGVNRLFISAVDVAHLLGATLHFEHLRALGQEHRQNLDRLLHDAATIATVVEHQTTQTTRLAHCHQFATQIGSATLVEVAVRDVTDRVVQPTRIGHARNGNSLAAQGQRHHAVVDQSRHLQTDLGSGVAFQAIAHLLGGHTLGRFAVDLDDAVADLDTCTIRRTTFVGLGKTHIITLLANQRTHTAILARGHHLELLDLLFGHIGRVRVECRGHTLGSIFHQFIGVGFVDIEHVQLAHHIDQHLDIATERKIVTRRGRQHNRHSHDRHRRRNATHDMFRVLRHSLFSYKFPSDR